MVNIKVQPMTTIRDTMTELYQLRKTAEAAVGAIDKLISTIRESCPHPNQTDRQNLGGERDYNCPDCGRTW